MVTVEKNLEVKFSTAEIGKLENVRHFVVLRRSRA
jgi:hypothetical protein